MKTRLIATVVGAAALLGASSAAASDDEAVPLALKWLAAQQNDDGSWSFDCPADDDAESAGRGTLKNARNGATGLAMLAFLSVGETHKRGKYRKTVKSGLDYLVRNMKVSGDCASLEDPDGRLYSHAWAALALCEACAMTRDKGLEKPAQRTLNHIVHCQDRKNGGWRYRPKGPCNSVLVGWMCMALKSGHMAYLKVSPDAVKLIEKYLDSVQSDDGASYGYAKPGTNAETTAVGLLCRCWLGWKRDHPALRRGLDALSKRKPRPGRLNETYFLTSLLWFAGDDAADRKWRSEVRHQLTSRQSTKDPHAGSWHFPDGEPAVKWGGRLYCTAVSTLILAVRYRPTRLKLPPSVTDDFPL